MKYTLIPRSREAWKKKPSCGCLKKEEKKVMRKRDSKYKKKELKTKKEKECNWLKELRLHQARHTSSWRSSST
jgi:hypothetical protein